MCVSICMYVRLPKFVCFQRISTKIGLGHKCLLTFTDKFGEERVLNVSQGGMGVEMRKWKREKMSRGSLSVTD